MNKKTETALKWVVGLLIISIIMQIILLLFPQRKCMTIDNEHVRIEYIQKDSEYYTIEITDKKQGSWLFPIEKAVDLQKGFTSQEFVNYIE